MKTDGDTMKIRLKWFPLLVLFVIPLNSVQARSGFGFFLQTGVSIPKSPALFSEIWGVGPAITVGVSHPLGNLPLHLQTQIGYSRFGFDRTKYREFIPMVGVGTIAPGTAKILNILIDLMFEPIPTKARLTPYLLAGAGSGSQWTTEGVVQLRVLGDRDRVVMGEDSGPILSLGGGFKLMLPKNINLFIEARYEVGFLNGATTRYLPIRFGVAYK